MRSVPVIVGIDPSSLKLTAVIGPLGCKVGRVMVQRRPLTHRDIVERAYQARNWVHDVLAVAWEFGDEIWVGVESPVLGKGGAWATIQQSIVHGALLSEFHDYEGVRVFQVNNTRWKKQMVGNGNAGKPEIARWVRKNFPEYVKRTALPRGGVDQDACDALGVWHSASITARTRRRMAHTRQRVRQRQAVGGRR